MVSVVESFLSLQGEGKFAGRLAIFIRLAGCNLECKGFGVTLTSPKTGEKLIGCDTIRAVKMAHFESKKFDFAALCDLVLGYKFSQKPVIVITGGEPLLWHKDRDFLSFISWALDENYEVHFETNGTIFVDFSEFELYKRCKFTVSVKLSVSGEIKEKRIKKEALNAIFTNANAFYKFVVSKENLQSSLDEISEILSIQNGEVWCMPLGKNVDELSKNALSVADFCIKNGFNYTDRLHIRLWNDKEGV